MYVGRYMYNFVFLKFYRSTVDFQCANFCCTSKLFSYIHVCVCVYIYIYIYSFPQICGYQDEGGKGKDWQLRIHRCKLVHIGWINIKVLLCTTGNHIQYHVINHNRKEQNVLLLGVSDF